MNWNLEITNNCTVVPRSESKSTLVQKATDRENFEIEGTELAETAQAATMVLIPRKDEFLYEFLDLGN